MANGSFGLSGLPTAPTTVSGSGSIVNPFTQTEVTLASVNGFNAGDFVYQYNGDYQAINSTATASATFPVETQKVTNIGSGLGGFQQIQSNQFNNQARNTTTLSNGNIVWVYNKYTTGGTYPYFKITDENNTVIVAETVIEAVGMPDGSTGAVVAALSGTSPVSSGFVVAWVNSSNNIRYVVYTNAGTVTTALQNDTGVTVVSGFQMSIAPRPVTGGFVIAIQEATTGTYKHRVYGATGVATYAWTSNNTTSLGGAYTARVAVRSDDSFVIVSQPPTTSNMVYYLWSSTNAAVTNSSFIVGTTSGIGFDVCALTNDVYIITGRSTTGLVYRTLTGSTLSGANVQISQNFSSTQSGSYSALRSLSNGGWAVVYTLNGTIDASSQLYAGLVYVNVYNSAGTLLSVTYKGTNTTYTGTPFNFIPGSMSPNTYIGLTETTNYIHVVTNGYNSTSKTQQWARFNKTAYTPVAFTTATISAVNTAALPTAAYAPANSTPTGAAFYAASTSTVGWSTASTTSAIVNAALTTIDTDMGSINFTDSTSLTNGGAVVAYSGSLYGGGSYTRFTVYNNTGVQVVPVTTLDAANTAVRVIGLTSNKFVIWSSGGLYVYSNAGLRTASLAVNLTVDTNHPLSLAPLPDGKFVVMANASSSAPTTYYLRYTVYDDSLNVVSGPTTVDALNSYPSQVATLGSNIYIFYQPSGSAGTVNRMSEYLQTSTNTWTLYSNNTITSGYPLNTRAFGMGNGSLLRSYSNNAGLGYITQISTDGSTYSTNNLSLLNNGITTNQCPIQVAPTCNGNTMFLTSNASNNLSFQYGFGGSGSILSSATIAGSYTSGAKPTAAGLLGEKVLFGYASYNTSTGREFMSVAIFNIGTYQGTQPIVAGSSISNASTVLGISTGYRLIGVATSTAPAGGTGTVVINGSVELNSSYQSIASPGQSFDFSGPVRFGAAGSVIGRSVTLQGNV